MSTRHHRLTDPLLAFGVGLAAFALYLRTLAPGLLWGDSAEFQLAAWLGGFAHPTGYPLYLMLGWLWTHLPPLGDPAWRMNLFSALWGGVAVGLVYLVTLQILRRDQFGMKAVRQPPLGLAGLSGSWSQPAEASSPEARFLALAAALVFAVTPTFWSQAVVAEVYTLHAAFVAAILLAVLAWADRPAWPRLYLLAGLVGLSLAHHRTTLLLLPGLALFMLIWKRGFSRSLASTGKPIEASLPTAQKLISEAEAIAGRSAAAPSGEDRTRTRANGRGNLENSAPVRARPRPIFVRRLLTAVALLLAPLLLYAYIPLIAPHTPYFTLALGPVQTLALYEPTVAGFLAHISGSIFGSALGAARGPWLAELAPRLAGELTWPGVALGLVGIIWLAWRDRRALALTGLTFVAFVLFNVFYAIGDIYVFYIPVYLIWVLWMGVGVWACGCLALSAFANLSYWSRGFSRSATERKKPPEASSPRFSTLFVVMATPIVLLALAGWLLSANFAQVDRSADHTARAVWDAVLAQPISPDAILITNDRDEMVPQWHLRYAEGRRPDLTGLFPLIQPGPAWSDVAAVTEQALRTGRPVYLIKPMPGLEVKFTLAPVPGQVAEGIGALVRVLGPAAGSELAQDSAAAFGDQIRLAGYEARPAQVSAGQPLEVILDWEPLAPLAHDYTTFVHLVNAEGRVIGQSDHRPGGVYYPTSLWRAGDRVRDVHQLTIADDLGPGPYVLEVGLYRLAPDLQHLGSPQRVGEIDACG